MRLFKNILTPIIKDVPITASVKSHRLLVQAGFIDQSSSGMFTLLPLAFRVLENVKRVIREELGNIGADELYLPIMTDAALWKASGRWEDAGDELFRLQDRKEHQYCLAATHEETVTQLVASHVTTYRQLPVYVYQTQTKFRDEQRPRHGLVRAREFVMKDMYTFDKTEEDAIATYYKTIDAYKAIFNRISLPFEIVAADTGMIGGSLSHEFHVPTEIGEDTLITCKTCSASVNLEKISDIVTQCEYIEDSGAFSEPESENDITPPSEACSWNISKGIEIGHAFYLGTKYSGLFNAQYTNQDGKTQTVEMGCYGIGVSRILSALAEVHSDDEGLVWPSAIAPFQVCLCIIGKSNLDKKMEYCQTLYDKLSATIPDNVIVDDRVSSKFKNRMEQLRMVGIPHIILVGDKSLETEGSIELLSRTSTEKIHTSLDDFMSMLQLFTYLKRLVHTPYLSIAIPIFTPHKLRSIRIR